MVAKAQTSPAAGESSQYPSGERADSLGPGGCAHGNGTCSGTDSEVTRSGGGARCESRSKETESATRDARLAKSGFTRIHSWMSRLRWAQLQTLTEVSTETYGTVSLSVEQFT